MRNPTELSDGPHTNDPGLFFEGTAGDDTQNGTTNDDGFLYSQGGNDTLNGLDGNDEFMMGGTFNALDHIDGGTGYDILFLDGDYSAGGSWTESTIVGIEEIRLAGGNDYAIGALADAVIAAGERLTIDASALRRNDQFGFNGALETDGAVTVIGGKGSDTVTVGKGANVVDGNAGNDIVLFNNGFDPGSSANGGKGLDSMVLQLPADAVLDFTSANLKGVESLSFRSGVFGTDFHLDVSVDDGVVAAGATLFVNVQEFTDMSIDLDFNGEAETDGHFSLVGGSLTDSLAGGALSDTIDVSQGGDFDFALGKGGDDTIRAGAALNTVDFLDGGDGFDTLELNGATTVAMDETTIRSIERIVVADGFNYVLTTHDFNVAPGEAMEVDGSALLTGILIFDGSADSDSVFTLVGGANGDSLSGGERADTITGGAGDDQVSGFAKPDVLSGGGGDDNIYGGLGADTINSGAGRDKLRYNAVPESTGSGHDELIGFDFTKDFFSLNFEVTAIDPAVNNGALNDASFDTDLKAAIGAGKLGGHHAVLFTASAGDRAGETFLIVDANGNAGYQAEKDFVMLLSNPAHLGALDTGDFIAEI